MGEREALAFAVGASIQPISERFRKVHGARTGPVQAKRSVGHFIEEIQILNRRVVHAKRRTDAGFPRSSKDLTQQSVAKAGRVGNANARSEIVVSRRSKRLGNTRVSRIHKACGRKRKHSGLLSLNPSLDLALGVIPRHTHFPAKTQVQCQIRRHFPCVLRISAAIARARIQQL